MNTLLTIISLLFFLIATLLIALNRYLWDAALLLFLALISFAIIQFHKSDAQASPQGSRRRFLPKTTGAWLRIAAVFISIFVTLNARTLPPNSNFTLLFLLWCAGILAFSMSLLIPLIRQHLLSTESITKPEWIFLIALILVASIVRGAGVGRIPANLGGDEGTQLLLGTELVSSPFGNPFATGWFSVPTMSFALYGLSMRVWGTTMAGGRVLSVIVGTCSVLLTFLLGRSLGGRRFGWISAIIIAFSAYHIHFSRLASNQIFDSLIGTLVFFLFIKALNLERTGSTAAAIKLWGLAGVAAGFGWYTYFGARWVTFLIGLVILWWWVSQRDFLRQHAKGLLMFALGWIIIILPLLGWYYEHPSAFTERYNAVSVFASGWLSREVIITGKSAVQLMLEQFWKSATAFHLTPDPTFWYYPEQPLVDIITGMLMLAGMISCFWQIRWPSKALTLLWFWSTVLMAWVVTENPPSSQRGLLLVPAAAFLGAWGFDMLWSIFSSEKRYYRYILVLLTVLAVFLNLNFYFGIYAPRRSYGNPTAEIATKIAHYTLANPQPACVDAAGTQCDGAVFFLGPPRLYWGFGSIAFMLRNFPGLDVMPGKIPNDITIPARFILIEDRIGEIGALMQTYPGGELEHIVNHRSQTIAIIYDWLP